MAPNGQSANVPCGPTGCPTTEDCRPGVLEPEGLAGWQLLARVLMALEDCIFAELVTVDRWKVDAGLVACTLTRSTPGWVGGLQIPFSFATF